jgi:hypothetical protein
MWQAMIAAMLAGWLMKLASRPFGPKQDGLDELQDGDIVFVVDVSGSMQAMINFLQTVLQNLEKVMQIIGARVHLVVVSDYDRGHFREGGVVGAVFPRWFIDSIQSSEEYRGLTNAKTMKAQDIAKQSSTPEEFLAQIGQARDARGQLMFSNQLQMWQVYLESWEVEQGDSQGAAAPNSDDKYTWHDNRVFKFLGSGITNVVQALSKFIIGTTIVGSGFSSQEAFKTAILAVATAAKKNDAKVTMFILSDQTPHFDHTSDKVLEDEFLRDVGLPSDVHQIHALCEAQCIRLIYLLSSDNMVPTDAGHARGSFVQEYVKRHPNCAAIVHNQFMADIDVFNAVLMCGLSIATTGKPQEPWKMDDDKLSAIASKMDTTPVDCRARINAVYANFRDMQIVIADDADMANVPLPTTIPDEAFAVRVIDAFLSVMMSGKEDIKEVNPTSTLVMTFMTFLSGFFYTAKTKASAEQFQKFGDFMSWLSKNRDVHAMVSQLFVEAQHNTADEALKAKIAVFEQLPLKDKKLIYIGEPLNKATFSNFGKALTPASLKKLQTAMENFRIVSVTPEDLVMPVAERLFLPVEVLDGDYAQIVLSMATGFVNYPKQFNTLKWAMCVTGLGTKARVPLELRESMRVLFAKNMMKLYGFILDDAFKPPEGKNIYDLVQWQKQPLVLTVAKKALQSLQVDPEWVLRLDFCLRTWQVQQNLNKDVNVSLHQYEVVHHHGVELRKCHAGKWVPITLFAGGNCVYCSVHGPLTQEGEKNVHQGTAYHDDGTSEAYPFGDTNVCVRDGMRTKCSECKGFYAVMDVGYGQHKPRCVNCRRGMKAPVRACAGCGDNWIHGDDPGADWQCARCKFGNQLDEVTDREAHVTVTVLELLSVNDQLCELYAHTYGVTVKYLKGIIMMTQKNIKMQNFQGSDKNPEFHLMVRKASKLMVDPKTPSVADFTHSIGLPEGKDIKFDDIWPFAKRTSNQAGYMIDQKNITTVIANIREDGLTGSCSFGICGRDEHPITELIAPCGGCSFMVCRPCLKSLTHTREGCVTPVRRLMCFCGSPISQGSLTAIGHGQSVVMKKVQEAYATGRTDWSVAVCCGAHHVDDSGRIHVACHGGNRRTTLQEPNSGPCGTEDADVTDHLCIRCQPVEEKWQVSQARIRMEREAEEQARQAERIADAHTHTKADLSIVQASYHEGTVLRACPDCGYYGDHDGACAKMTCPQCSMRWCWICRFSAPTSGDVYDHFDEEAGDGYHDDWLSVGSHTELLNTEDVLEGTGGEE